MDRVTVRGGYEFRNFCSTGRQAQKFHLAASGRHDIQRRMSAVTLLGYLAAAVSTASFLPQAWKIIKSRQTKDISFGMYLLTIAAFGLWLTFGILARQWPLVVSNSICFILSAFILAMKVLPQSRKNAVADALEKPGR